MKPSQLEQVISLSMPSMVDGAVEGCPSLQTARYLGGNLRESTLA